MGRISPSTIPPTIHIPLLLCGSAHTGPTSNFHHRFSHLPILCNHTRSHRAPSYCMSSHYVSSHHIPLYHRLFHPFHLFSAFLHINSHAMPILPSIPILFFLSLPFSIFPFPFLFTRCCSLLPFFLPSRTSPPILL